MDKNQFLVDYEGRIKRGEMAWRNDAGQAFLDVQTKDSTGAIVGTFNIPFDQFEVEKARNEDKKRILHCEDQIIELRRQIAEIEARGATLDLVSKDIETVIKV